jgi:hypothetical protein
MHVYDAKQLEASLLELDGWFLTDLAEHALMGPVYMEIAELKSVIYYYYYNTCKVFI